MASLAKLAERPAREASVISIDGYELDACSGDEVIKVA